MGCGNYRSQVKGTQSKEKFKKELQIKKLQEENFPIKQIIVKSLPTSCTNSPRYEDNQSEKASQNDKKVPSIKNFEKVLNFQSLDQNEIEEQKTISGKTLKLNLFRDGTKYSSPLITQLNLKKVLKASGLLDNCQNKYK